jgi:hypothetical protein
MDLPTKDDFHSQTAGTLLALRVIIVSMLKTHPEPERLLRTIDSVLALPGALDGLLPPSIQVVFDGLMQEMISHLRERPGNENSSS